MNLVPLATVLINRHRAINEGARPIDVKVARGTFNGALAAAHAMGIGHTPFHIESTVLDVLREATPRPLWKAIDNSAQHAYDTALAETLAAALTEIA